ncbi:MAG: cryptochrome/photolyase family protein, partial [Candidatus Latescibacterota bacterium]
MSDYNWTLVAPDQLTDRVGPLKSADPSSTGVILIESLWWAKRRPHHKQRIAFVFSNLRHFAAELEQAGFEVRYLQTAEPHGVAAAEAISKLGSSVTMMEPASRELRVELEPLVASGDIRMVANETWLTSRQMFEESQDGPPWLMDRFYRHVRKTTGLLMQDGEPVGGKFSFDHENRDPWHGNPPAPEPPTFERDEIKEEVCNMVERLFDQNPGRLNPDRLPASRVEAEAAWSWALENALPQFGPYEDAMSSASSTLFHTLISPLINLSRLLPHEVLDDALESRIPLQSLEGFVRQVIGWREFVKHVHDATDGFRNVAGETITTAPESDPSSPAGLDRGAQPNYLRNELPLPPAYWGEPSGLNCLDTVVEDVLAEG